MHINAYITSNHFLFLGMCGRTHDLSSCEFYGNLKACIKICSALKSYKFNSSKGLIMPLKQNRLSVRNLKLDWYIYLFRKHTRPFIHHENDRTLKGDESSCCESHVVILIKFLIRKCREIFRKELLVLPKEEGDRPSITSNLKGYTKCVFKLDHLSSLGERPSVLTTHNFRRGLPSSIKSNQSLQESCFERVNFLRTKFTSNQRSRIFCDYKELPFASDVRFPTVHAQHQSRSLDLLSTNHLRTKG